MKIIQKLIVTTTILFSSIAASEVSVIVNKDNANSLDTNTIKKVYLGKVKSFADGGKIQVLTLPDDKAATEEFRTKALKKSNSQYKSYWSKLVFTGKANPPKEMSNDASLIDAVKSDKNAIGFVDAASVTPDVKVIASY